METKYYILIASLIIGAICTFLLVLDDRKPFMKRETYRTLSLISFIFNMGGSFMCLYLLVNAN